MGRVYRARQAPLGRIVAIKVLQMHQGIADDPHFKRRFFMEASLTAQLRHPNTIQIIDYGEEGEGGDEILFIAMEYLQGTTLADLMEREGRLHWTRAFSITQQVARSLREAHGHGVIHRDLKPANLMLVHEEPGHDLVKVLDFGLVKAWRDGASVPESDLQMTQKGVILGSAFYMAPEQAHGKGDPRTDVYALGVILFHLLTGKLPFDGATSMEVIVKHHSRPIPRLSEMTPGLDVPPEVEALVRRCMAKRPDDRPQDMNVLLEEMRALAHLSEGGIRGSRTDLPVLGADPARPSGARDRIEQPAGLFGSQRKDPSGDRRTLAAGVFIAAILLGVGGMFVLQRSDDVPAAPVEAAAPITETVFLVETEPAGATVIVDGEELGQTPLRFSRPLPSEEGEEVSAEVRLSLEGYFPMTLQATSDGRAEVRVMRSLVALDPAPDAGRARSR